MKRKQIRIIGTVIAIIIGIYAIYLGGMHGYYEVKNGSKNPSGIFFDAISGNSLAIKFPDWPGWPAMSIIPNLLVTGILVIIIASIILFWLLLYNNHKKWGQILLIMAIIFCLFGGGFKPPFFIIIAGIIGTIINRIDQKGNL
jgi:hypothetical protein